MATLASFDFTSWYAYTVYVVVVATPFVAGYVLWSTFFEKLSKQVQWLAKRVHPITHPGLRARVESLGDGSYNLVIANSGDVSLEAVECGIPDGVTHWHLSTEVLPSYPIRVLEPDESATIPLALAMGPHTAVEVTLRGRVGDVPYERTQTISMFG